jgi:hypothetical protein
MGATEPFWRCCTFFLIYTRFRQRARIQFAPTWRFPEPHRPILSRERKQLDYNTGQYYSKFNSIYLVNSLSMTVVQYDSLPELSTHPTEAHRIARSTSPFVSELSLGPTLSHSQTYAAPLSRNDQNTLSTQDVSKFTSVYYD